MATKNQVKSTNGFVTKALAQLNKSEAQIQKENLELFVKRSTIEIQQQISIRRTNMANLELDLQAANSKLEMAQEQFNKARFTQANNFETYLNNRTNMQEEVDSCQSNVDEVQNTIEYLNDEIAELELVLNDFQ